MSDEIDLPPRPCPKCGQPSIRSKHKIDDLSILGCEACRVVFVADDYPGQLISTEAPGSVGPAQGCC